MSVSPAPPNTRQIPEIVLTGGPCGGKTTAIETLKQVLTDRGWTVLVSPEPFTLLSDMGAHPLRLGLTDGHGAFDPRFMRILIRTHEAVRHSLLALASSAEVEKVVLIHDRTAKDTEAWMDSAQFAQICSSEGLGPDELIHSYLAVFHLETVAKHHPHEYSLESNEARTETADAASTACDRLLTIWSEHTNFTLIPGEQEFTLKIDRLVASVLAALGEPALQLAGDS